MRRFLLTFIILAALSLNAQEDSRSLLNDLDYKVEFQSSVSDGQTPLWLNANKHGLSSLDEVNGYLRGMVERPLVADSARNWGFGYALDLVAPLHYTSNFIIQQAFIEARWKKGVVTIGSKEFPMELKNNELSSGSQTLGINARPVPQVRLALPDYWIIPGTKNWLALKGHIAYGKTTDDQWQKDFTDIHQRYTEGTLYHSKAGYLKIGPKNLTVVVGLEMACQFGGKTIKEENGNQVVVTNASDMKSFVNAFLPGGSGSDEETSDFKNAEGNQLGSWLARLNFDYDRWYLGIYADHFFEDHSSMFFLDYDGYGSGSEWDVKKKHRYFVYSLKDIQLGLDFRLKDNYWINNLLVEYIYTKYQSGPIYHDHTPHISDHVCGIDNYYNHYIFTGWQHWGQAIGNPLYRSPLYNEDGTINFQNNRFVAWHFGIAGSPNYNLHYRLLATFQRSLGTYTQPFANPQSTQHLLAEADYRFSYYSPLYGWSVKAAVGADFGKTYGKNLGFQLTIAKTGTLLKGKKVKR